MPFYNHMPERFYSRTYATSSSIPTTAANNRVGWKHISEPETFWMFEHLQCSQGIFVRDLNNMLSPTLLSDRKLFTTYCVFQQKSIVPETNAA